MTYTATTSRSQDLSAPRSPTLSISMVHEAERNVSPPPYMSPAFHRAPPLVQTRKQLSAQSSRSTLRTAMGDARAVNNHAREELLASSPTINGLNSPQNWTPKMAERRSSVASSLLSEDFENWPGFESHDKFDDSGLGMEEQESRDQFPGDTDTREEMETERWLSRHSSGSDESDDPYSSAALSRRAEIILANAKKRLNVMEGNLRGARESLVVSPTFNSRRSPSDASLQINTTRDRDRRLYGGQGPIPPRVPFPRSSPRSPTSPSHARGLSETSVPLPFSSPTYMTRTAANKRASSAIGHTTGPWSPEGTGPGPRYGQGRFPIKESRSVEVLREQKPEPQYPVRTTSRQSRSPPALETLQEDEDAQRVHRSSSAASGLRDQMMGLKERISTLKLRAQEDQLRRRSMQSLRTSSPFTNAQEWYSGTDTHHAEGAPVTANAGLGITKDSPIQRALHEEGRISPHSSRTTHSQQDGEMLVGEDAGLGLDLGNGHGSLPRNDMGHEDFDDLESYTDEHDYVEADQGEYVSVNDDELEQAPDSVYEDAVYEMPATERHEDRVDAFDYEHFFLHSAMGTYSLEGRRSSTASDSSTATTRPVTAMQVQDDDDLSASEKRVSYHSRNPSSDSVSTVASFATAAETHSDDEENEQMDHFSSQILAHNLSSRPPTSASHTSLRSDSAINMRRAAALTRGSASPADLASGLQVSKIFSILTEVTSPTREEPRLSLNEEEKQLIYSLASSFQQVCEGLQHEYGDQYERKVWRSRLDEARRVLNGEVREEENDEDDEDSF